MNQIWNETDIVIIQGEEYLNEEASARLFEVYKDKLKQRVENQLYKLSWAVKVCNSFPRTYQAPTAEQQPSPKEEPKEQELEGANEIYNLENVKKVMTHFESVYSANSNVDLVSYLLANLIRVINQRPITGDDMIKFGNYIVSQPQYKTVNWNPEKLKRIIELGQLEAFYKIRGLEATLQNKVSKPENVIEIIKVASKKDPITVIEVLVAGFLATQSEDFQKEVEGLLQANGMTEILEFVKKAKKPEEQNEMSEVEKFIIEAYKQVNANNPKMTQEQWLFSLLDSIYIKYNLKADDVKDYIVKHVVNKPPYNIDMLTLSTFVIEKDRQIHYCKKESDILVEELIIKDDESNLYDNLDLVYYNVDENKWLDFASKLAARVFSDLTSISVVDPVTVRKLCQIIIICNSYHDDTLINSLVQKFGKSREELVSIATNNIAKLRIANPFEGAGASNEGSDEETIDLDEDEELDLEYDEDDEEELDVVSRRKPMTKEGKQKILYASIAGVGVISTLFLTFVQGYNPVTVVSECVKTFGALLKNNATLSQLGVKLGQLSVYFASAIVSFKSLFKFADTFDEDKVNNKKNKRKSREHEFEDEELVDEDDDYSFIDESDLVDGLDDEDIHRVAKR